MADDFNDNEPSIEDLLEERRQLLAKNPELIPLQKEIDRALSAVGNDPLKRAERACELLKDHVQNELIPEIDRARALGIETKDKKRRLG